MESGIIKYFTLWNFSNLYRNGEINTVKFYIQIIELQQLVMFPFLILYPTPPTPFFTVVSNKSSVYIISLTNTSIKCFTDNYFF